MALSWLKQGVMNWFCEGLINSLMETLSALPILCVVEETDAPSPTVHLSSTILGGTFCTKRGQFALGQSVPGTSCPRANGLGGHSALGQDVPGGILRGGQPALLQRHLVHGGVRRNRSKWKDIVMSWRTFKFFEFEELKDPDTNQSFDKLKVDSYFARMFVARGHSN